MLVPATIPKPVWTGTVAGYHLVKWSRETKDDTLETLFIKDQRGRVVAALHDFRVTPLFGDDWPKPRDLNHDGVPEVVFTTWSGGAHGSNTYHVWSLGKHPRCLLAYDKNNVSDGHDFEFVDLDGDGIPEIRSWYDGFAYTVGASNWKNLPVVLKLVNGRYVDRTSRYPKLLAGASKAAWGELMASNLKGQPGSWEGPSSSALNLIALADLTQTRPQLWRRLKAVVPAKTYAWLKKREPAILAIARGRCFRYAYPKAYSTRPVEFPQSAEMAAAFDVFENP